MSVQTDAIALVLAERDRQDAKWGSQRQLPSRTWLTVLVEEVGEVARADLERDTDGLRKEVIQVCAVALAWVEAIEAAARPEAA